MPMRSSVWRSKALTSSPSADGQQMQVEIDQRRGDVFQRLAAAVEVLRRHQLLHQRLGDRLAGLVVAGELAQHLRLLEPVLVELRRQLDPVGQHAGAGDGRIGDVGEQAMQPVAHLVEQGAGVLERQQRRVALVEVHHVEHHRAHVAGELLLIAQACPSRRRHACSGARNSRRRRCRHGRRPRRAPPRPAHRDARPAPRPDGTSARTASARRRTPPRSRGRAGSTA